jgi:predicted RNA methylase
LGFCLKDVEDKIFQSEHSQKEVWRGLDPQSFQTPYAEFEEMFDLFPAEQGPLTWVDLGAGYGRLALCLHQLRPQDQFYGYELVQERVTEANRVLALQGSRFQLVQKDLSDPQFVIPEADIYFIYDFGSRRDVEVVLEKLKTIAQRKSICVIARGRGVTNWIYQSHQWLYCNQDPVKSDHWILFKS